MTHVQLWYILVNQMRAQLADRSQHFSHWTNCTSTNACIEQKFAGKYNKTNVNIITTVRRDIINLQLTNNWINYNISLNKQTVQAQKCIYRQGLVGK